MIDRLSEAITNAGIPLERIEGSSGPGNYLLVFQAVATQPQQDQAASIASSFDWSFTAHLEWLAAKAKAADRAAAQSDSTDGLARILRGVVIVLVDELNDLRQWITSFKSAVAAASNLADLKTRVAALANTPARTLAQARNAVANKISDGEADN